MVTLFVTSAIDQWQDTDRRGMAAVVVTDEPHYRSHDTTNKTDSELRSSCGRQHVTSISPGINEHSAVHDNS